MGYRMGMLRPVVPMLLLMMLPAQAGETAWQDVAPDTRVRLISSGVVAPDGTTLIGVEIDMPEGVKTYWRVAGETGIPTQFDFAGSHGISRHEVVWPYPTIDTASGYVDFSYFGDTVLPVRVVLSGPEALVHLSVEMGVCSEICIPASATFAEPLELFAPDTAQDLRLRQAVAEAPLAWEDGVPAIEWVGFDPHTDTLTVHTGAQNLDPDSLIADTGAAGILFGAPQKSPEAGIIYLPLLGKSTTDGLEGHEVTFTFMTDMGPFWQAMRISPVGN